jgi:hypothetical protein
MSFTAFRHLLVSCSGLLAGGWLIATTSGCVAVAVGAAAGAGTVAYQRGSLVSHESAGMDATWSACQGAIKRLEFEEEGATKDALEGTLEARSGNGRTITFKLRRISENSTELRIRVGMFGDEAMTRQIHEAVRKSL